MDTWATLFNLANFLQLISSEMLDDLLENGKITEQASKSAIS